MGNAIREKSLELDKAQIYRKINCEGFYFYLPEGFKRTKPGESPFIKTGIRVQQTFYSPVQKVHVNILSGEGTKTEKIDVIKELYMICMLQKRKLSFFEQGGVFRNPQADEGMTSYSFTDYNELIDFTDKLSYPSTVSSEYTEILIEIICEN